jgi:hypothetical protein
MKPKLKYEVKNIFPYGDCLIPIIPKKVSKKKKENSK